MEWIKSTYINGIPTIIIRQTCTLNCAFCNNLRKPLKYTGYGKAAVYVFDVNNYGFEFLHDKMKISLHDMVL